MSFRNETRGMCLQWICDFVICLPISISQQISMSGGTCGCRLVEEEGKEGISS